MGYCPRMAGLRLARLELKESYFFAVPNNNSAGATIPCDPSRQTGPYSVLESEDQQIRLLCVERCVVVRRQLLRLTPIECTLLFTLMREGGKVLTHELLLHAVWGSGYQDEVDYIRVYLHTLRLKLEDDPRRPTYLETIMGVGYRFRQPCFSQS